MGSTTRNYLILYNATMGIGWTYIFYEVTKLLFITYDPISANYVNPPSIKQLLNVVYILQACATLEIFHSLFGLVGGNVGAAVAQIVGRNHILFANIYFLPILWDHISVAYLLFFWSTIEVVRYPAYLFALISPDNILSRTFSWLRYTIFIPLYPLGFGTELWIYLAVLGIVYDQTVSEPLTGQAPLHTVRLPNPYNFGFDYFYFLVFFLVIAILGFINNYKYMFVQRARRYNKAKKE